MKPVGRGVAIGERINALGPGEQAAGSLRYGIVSGEAGVGR